MDDILLTETETANFLGKSIVTLGRWRREGYGPKAIRVGRSPRYTRQSLADFMNANGIRPGGKPVNAGSNRDDNRTISDRPPGEG
jgi:hypothetical protein